MSRFHHANDGEWMHVTFPTHIISCCHCQLCHRLDFRMFTDAKGQAHLMMRARQLMGMTRKRRASRASPATAIRRLR